MLTPLSTRRAFPINVWLAITTVGLLLPGAALAACNTPATEALPQAQLGATVSDLLDVLPDCQKSALWLANLGHYLNRLGRYQEAADHLERALLLEPELPGARLDYALSLAGLGDTSSALALVNDLLAAPNVPNTIRIALEHQKARWRTDAGAAYAWQVSGMVSARLGFDSNLLGSPNLNALTLTFPGQTQILPLDPDNRPKAGGYQRADAQMLLRRDDPDGAHWDINASLRRRDSPHVAGAGTTQLDLQLEYNTYQYPAVSQRDSTGYYLSASVSALDAQAGTRYRALGVAGGWATQGQRPSGQVCQARLGLELQQRDYISNALLSGRYAGLAAAWSCVQPAGAQWLLGLKAGRDTAFDAARPGGDQNQFAMRLVGYLPLQLVSGAAKGAILSDLELAHSRDAGAYSALLRSGLPRTITRASARMEYQHPISQHAQWVFGAEWVAQQSNLDLFNMQSRGLYTALRLSW